MAAAMAVVARPSYSVAGRGAAASESLLFAFKIALAGLQGLDAYVLPSHVVAESYWVLLTDESRFKFCSFSGPVTNLNDPRCRHPRVAQLKKASDKSSVSVLGCTSECIGICAAARAQI